MGHKDKKDKDKKKEKKKSSHSSHALSPEKEVASHSRPSRLERETDEQRSRRDDHRSSSTNDSRAIVPYHLTPTKRQRSISMSPIRSPEHALRLYDPLDCSIEMESQGESQHATTDSHTPTSAPVVDNAFMGFCHEPTSAENHPPTTVVDHRPAFSGFCREQASTDRPSADRQSTDRPPISIDKPTGLQASTNDHDASTGLSHASSTDDQATTSAVDHHTEIIDPSSERPPDGQSFINHGPRRQKSFHSNIPLHERTISQMLQTQGTSPQSQTHSLKVVAETIPVIQGFPGMTQLMDFMKQQNLQNLTSLRQDLSKDLESMVDSRFKSTTTTTTTTTPTTTASTMASSRSSTSVTTAYGGAPRSSTGFDTISSHHVANTQSRTETREPSGHRPTTEDHHRPTEGTSKDAPPTKRRKTTPLEEVETRVSFAPIKAKTSKTKEVDETHILEFINHNVRPIDEACTHFSTPLVKCKEDDIPRLDKVSIHTRPYAVRWEDAVIDLSDCPDHLWIPVLKRFQDYVENRTTQIDSDSEESDRESDDSDRPAQDYPTGASRYNETDLSSVSDTESVDSQLQDEITVSPKENDATALKSAITIMKGWDNTLRIVESPDTARKRDSPDDLDSDDDESEPEPAHGAKACLPPHPRVGKWYHFTDNKLRNNKTAKPGSAIHLDISKRATKLFSTGARAKHLYMERTFPLRFEKISSFKDDTKVQKVRTQALSLSAPMVRVTEALVRTGISTASYEIHFLTAIQKEFDEIVALINVIKSNTRDKHAHPTVVFKKIKEATDSLSKIFRDMKRVLETSQLAADINLSSWISMDFNMTLAQRDRLTSKLVDYMRFASNNLRRSSVESVDLFPDIEEVILSADKELLSKSNQELHEFIMAQNKKGKPFRSQTKARNFPRKQKKRGKGRAFRDNSNDNSKKWESNNSGNSGNFNNSSGYKGKGRGKGGNQNSGNRNFDRSKSK